MQLIIHADDFGMARSINEACIELCRLKTLSSVSVMANMPYSCEVEKLVPMKHVSLGLHSTFTEGKPLLSREEVSSLVDEKGNFYRYPEMMRRAKRNLLKVDHIFAELLKQHDALRALIGDRLSFIDSHHSIHNKLLPFRDAFLRFGRQLGVPAIRTRQMYYLEMNEGRAQLLRPDIGTLGRFGLRKVIANYFYRKRAAEFGKVFKIADGMVVEDALGAMNVFKNFLLLDLSADAGKTFYAVSHPATYIEDLPASNLSTHRLDEFEILCSPEFVNFVKQHPLSNFAEL